MDPGNSAIFEVRHPIVLSCNYYVSKQSTHQSTYHLIQCVLTLKNAETCCIECHVLSYVDCLYDDDDDDNSA